jgi:hypothetical protein
MDEQRIENALRAGPTDESPHRQGALGRALAERDAIETAGTFRVRLRPQSAVFSGLAAVVALVLLVAVIVVSGRLGQSAGPASPSVAPTTQTPSPSASASVVGVGAPIQLVDRWAGAVRPITILSLPPTRSFLDIQGASLKFDAGVGQPGNVFASAVMSVGPDTLRLTATTPTTGCHPFDIGAYRWSLSPAGVTLSLTAVDDQCSARATALSGFWTHTACRDATRDCLGPLERGTYTSNEFDPFGSHNAGQLKYTVLGGWSNSADNNTNYFLRPTADYLNDPGFDGGDTVSGIYVWAGTVAADQPADCAALPVAGVNRTADAIADQIAALSGLVVVDGGTVSIGGRQARELDITIDAAFSGTCPWSNGEPFRSLIMFADIGEAGGVWGTGPGTRQHVLFVDVAPDRVASIWVDGPADGFDDLLRDATPIIESIQFEDHAFSP